MNGLQGQHSCRVLARCAAATRALQTFVAVCAPNSREGGHNPGFAPSWGECLLRKHVIRALWCLRTSERSKSCVEGQGLQASWYHLTYLNLVTVILPLKAAYCD